MSPRRKQSESLPNATVALVNRDFVLNASLNFTHENFNIYSRHQAVKLVVFISTSTFQFWDV
jgi:hypothetical protein